MQKCTNKHNNATPRQLNLLKIISNVHITKMYIFRVFKKQNTSRQKYHKNFEKRKTVQHNIVVVAYARVLQGKLSTILTICHVINISFGLWYYI